MAHEAGKGDKRRPEDTKAYDEGYDRIFGKKRSQSPETTVEVNKLMRELYEMEPIVKKCKTT